MDTVTLIGKEKLDLYKKLEAELTESQNKFDSIRSEIEIRILRQDGLRKGREWNCDQCGIIVLSTDSTCWYCGADVEEQYDERKKKKDKSCHSQIKNQSL